MGFGEAGLMGTSCRRKNLISTSWKRSEPSSGCGFDRSTSQLHHLFHHLNSSQALCFNLFFPLIHKHQDGLNALLSSIGIDDRCGEAYFEFSPDPNERTCIDISLHLCSGIRVNFEVKYTESEFGAADSDSIHLQKFYDIYKPRLIGRFAEPFHDPTHFLRHYQVARNLWCLREEPVDIAVFLFPKGNELLKNAEEVIRSCAIEPFQSRIRVLYLEDLIQTLQSKLGFRVQSLVEFQLKYFPDFEPNEIPSTNRQAPA
jgi:hypothetical protein